jgi:hypothetical protein
MVDDVAAELEAAVDKVLASKARKKLVVVRVPGKRLSSASF